MFQEHEEVIVFTRAEFSRFYNSIQDQINYVNDISLHLDRREDWKIIGYWPKIMERVHIIDMNMDSILSKEPIQCYLDASLYSTVTNSQKKSVRSKRKVTGQIKLPI